MPKIETDEHLLAALKEAASRPLSAQEVEQQRISFVMGMLDEKNPMTREDVRRVINRHRGDSSQ